MTLRYRPMPLSDFITYGRNPFTNEKVEFVDYQALWTKNTEVPSRVVLDARRPKHGEDVHRGSRFGGEPILPPEVAWPEGPEGPLNFVGQLDFEQLRREHKGALPLPQRGLLSVFYDIENQPVGYESDDARSLSLVYVPDPSRAEPRESEDSDPVPLRLLQPKFEKKPRASGSPDHHICGSPPEYGDPRLSLQLLANGLDPFADLERLRADEREGVDVVSILKGAASWKLLWQIDSDDALFTWGDIGRLYLMIRDDDLAAHRFDETRCRLWCT